MVASFNEKLLLSNGLCIRPLKAPANGTTPSTRSLRDVVCSIDNEHDLYAYVRSFASKLASNRPELKYERHPVSMSPNVIASY